VFDVTAWGRISLLKFVQIYRWKGVKPVKVKKVEVVKPTGNTWNG
jgi:hypothetical protein